MNSSFGSYRSPKTIALVGKYHSLEIAESLRRLAEYLHERGVSVFIERETAEQRQGQEGRDEATTHQLACSSELSDTFEPRRWRASTAPLTESRRKRRSSWPDSSRALTTEPSDRVTLVPAVMYRPASTTHSIAGSIMGVGAAKSVSAVRWGVSARILWAWVLTIPCSAVIAVGSYLVMKALGPT